MYGHEKVGSEQQYNPEEHIDGNSWLVIRDHLCVCYVASKGELLVIM